MQLLPLLFSLLFSCGSSNTTKSVVDSSPPDAIAFSKDVVQHLNENDKVKSFLPSSETLKSIFQCDGESGQLEQQEVALDIGLLQKEAMNIEVMDVKKVDSKTYKKGDHQKPYETYPKPYEVTAV